MRSASVSIPVLLWIGTSAVAEPVETLTHCEDLSGWSRAAELSNDIMRGVPPLLLRCHQGELDPCPTILSTAGKTSRTGRV